MIDLEKEREAFEAWKKSDPLAFSNYGDFVVWLKRAELAQAVIKELKKEIAYLNDARKNSNGYILDLKQKLAQSETENKTMGSNNVWLNNKYGELEKKLASYESPDYVLVPRMPTEEMCEAMAEHVNSYDTSAWLDGMKAYKAMIEAVEKDND